MLTNIRGLIERLELSAAKGMMPLYEAISNAMDAIAERSGTMTRGRIRVRLLAARDLVREAGDETFVVDGFEVLDDGVGFNAANMGAFAEAYTRSKISLGGKGVGRFTFLKVFRTVHIHSVFEHQGERRMRDFDFSIDDDIRGSDLLETTTDSPGTRLTCRDMNDQYRPAWSSEPDVVAQRIVTHFLIRFAARACPAMELEAPEQPSIDLHGLFQRVVQPHVEETPFTVDGHHFSLQVFRQSDGRARHDYYLCANGREVMSGRLCDLLPELPDRLTRVVGGKAQSYTLIALVTGEYLDEHANRERTRIAFLNDDEPDLDESLITRASLSRGIAEALRVMLSEDLRTTHEEKFAQIARFVEQAPEYRVLTHERYRSLIERRVQPGLSDDQLDEALLHVRREVEDGVRKEERHVAALMESASFDQYQERIKGLMEAMNEVGKAKLADYVAHRRTILDLVDQSLRRAQADQSYPLERVLHKMIFPMGVSSKDVFLEQQNLWVIDERLCFHTLLTSDKKLNQVRGLHRTSGKEPDIFAFFYDTAVGIAEPDNLPGGGVVVIEFKRPGRDDYDKDPADQVIQRFVEINESRVEDIDGRDINPHGLRYIGYLIADLTTSLRRQVAMRYWPAADNEGYFCPLPGGNGYVEIISYTKLVRDAKRRNRVLFEKLGLHKS